ncbi:MAG: PIN domain-containing protein [Spiribacter sp.]|nr:PIN domain-containing protein [Spiribacter sp.]
MILIDTNVVLDVMEERYPHYAASATVIDQVVRRNVIGVLSAHAVTTIEYIVARHADAARATKIIEWLLVRFQIATVGKAQLVRAQSLRWKDFEDAVTAAAAETHGCNRIVTRNISDFTGSPVDAYTPEEYLRVF